LPNVRAADTIIVNLQNEEITKVDKNSQSPKPDTSDNLRNIKMAKAIRYKGRR